MATIILEPGETFEHTHDADTHTELIQGEATIRIGDEEKAMLINEQVRIPAHQPHTMLNTGRGDAIARCDYC